MKGHLKEFFDERADFLEVGVYPSLTQEGWDVCLRIDGTYAGLSSPLGATSGGTVWKTELLDALIADGIDPKQLRHWNGIPK